MSRDIFLVTGASDGIGAVYADRLARRGHDLILVARRAEKLAGLAAQIKAETGAAVEVLAADLSNLAGLALVEQRLREDTGIISLVNNAGVANEGAIATVDPDYLTAMIDLNVLAVARLTAAIAPRLASAGTGAIINIASVTALMPASFSAVYPATKAFVLAFSEALHAELGPRGVRIQAVLPGITRTPIWQDELLTKVPPHMVMDVGDMVDASLRGLDLGETVTIPSLPNFGDLEAYFQARTALAPNLSLSQPADRYLPH